MFRSLDGVSMVFLEFGSRKKKLKKGARDFGGFEFR